MSRQDRRQKKRQNQNAPLRRKTKANPWVITAIAVFSLGFMFLYFVANSH